MSSMYKHLILVSTGILFGGLLYIVKKWPYGINHTFSQHVARHKTAIIYYICLFSITLPLLLVFFFGWFVPEFDLSIWYKLCIFFAVAFQFLCAIIPEVGGTKTKIHRGLAFLSADLLLPAVIMLVFNKRVNLISQAISLFAVTVMTLIIVILVKNNTEHKYLLLLQSAYFFAFFLVIITATYS